MPHKKVSPLLCDTYIAVIKNSVGSNLFRNLYAKIGEKKIDITKNGTLSCAFFVSSILVMFGLIKEQHATVSGTVKDLKKSGWRRIKKPKIGSVLVWEEMKLNGSINKHIGFYIGENKAISNHYKLKQPAVRHWTSGRKNNKPIREIEAVFWSEKLIK